MKPRKGGTGGQVKPGRGRRRAGETQERGTRGRRRAGETQEGGTGGQVKPRKGAQEGR